MVIVERRLLLQLYLMTHTRQDKFPSDKAYHVTLQT